MPTNRTAASDATHDMAAIILALRKDIASLQASQAAANEDITYLRMNNDRIVREFSNKLRQLKNEVANNTSEIKKLHRSPRDRGLKRQGAFWGEDINNLPWDQMNDVRGRLPNPPQYNRSATPPPMTAHVNKKRTRDATESDAVAELSLNNNTLPTKRRKVSVEKRSARKSKAPHRVSASHPVNTDNSVHPSTSIFFGMIASVSSVFCS